MTVIVAFYCSDGVVIGADSMLTPTMGNISVGHHHGQKISVIDGPQLYAFAGDLGHSERVRIMANGSHAAIPGTGHPIDFPLILTQSIIQQFNSTGIGSNIGCSPVLSFMHSGRPQLCVFEGKFQPRMLDENHFFVALGSGKLSADPFLRFLTDIFCHDRVPTVADALFLTTWTIQHVIDVNPGGVAAPIRVATFELEAGVPKATLLPETEIDEHLQAVDSARIALLDWRNSLAIGGIDREIPDIPSAPEE